MLDQVRDQIRLRHYSIRTEQAYVSWIKRYILFHGKKHPKDLDKAEIEDLDLSVSLIVWPGMRITPAIQLGENVQCQGHTPVSQGTELRHCFLTFHFIDLISKFRDEIEYIFHNTHICHLENGSLLVFVYRHYKGSALNTS